MPLTLRMLGVRLALWVGRSSDILNNPNIWEVERGDQKFKVILG